MKSKIHENNLAKGIFYLFLTVSLLWIRIESMHAHGINLFARIEGDTVYVESNFSGGKGVNAGKITVLDSEGTELLRGKTDEKGEFSFKVPKKAELKIVLEDGAGHQAEWTVAANEIEMPAAAKKPESPKSNVLISILIGIGGIFFLTGIVAYIRKQKK